TAGTWWSSGTPCRRLARLVGPHAARPWLIGLGRPGRAGPGVHERTDRAGEATGRGSCGMLRRMERLGIDGLWCYTPRVHTDARGSFTEAFRAGEVREAVGHRFDLAQVNCSVSRRGVLRGVHFADVPPGQAKYVTCVAGAILDVVV